MSSFQCQTCGFFDTRLCNGDNEICTECSAVDDFDEVPTNEEYLDELEGIFDAMIESDVKCDGFHYTGRDIVHELRERI